MKIKILGAVKIRGKETALVNYQYIDENGNAISAVFQTVKVYLQQ